MSVVAMVVVGALLWSTVSVGLALVVGRLARTDRASTADRLAAAVRATGDPDGQVPGEHGNTGHPSGCPSPRLRHLAEQVEPPLFELQAEVRLRRPPDERR